MTAYVSSGITIPLGLSPANTTWQASHAYNISPVTGLWYNGTLWMVTTSGTSGATVPSWNSASTTITDGTVVWTQIQPTSKQYFPIPQHTVTPAYAYPDNISIGGRPFTANTSFEPYRREAFRHRTIQAQRQSINMENAAGYGTLNTEGLWRRDQLDWSNGAGQQFLDRKQDSSASRFLSSKGVNPWVENQLTLLNDTVSRVAGTNSNYKAITVGSKVFTLDGNTLTVYTATSATWGSGTAITVTGSPTLYDICTDGAYVYVGTSTGIYKVDGTTNTVSTFVLTGAITDYQITMVGFTGDNGKSTLIYNNLLPSSIQIGMKVSGPHIATGAIITGLSANVITLDKALTGTSGVIASDNIVFQVVQQFTITGYTMLRICNNVLIAAAKGPSSNAPCLLGFVNTPDPAAAPSAGSVLMIHPNLNFNWSCAAGGQTQIYLGGYMVNGQSTQGIVYRSSMTSVGSNSSVNQPFDLNYPIQCLPMETGEYPTAIYSYLNFIFLGTNLGIRMCQTLSVYDPNATQTGDLKAGALIPNLLQPVSKPVTGIVGDGRFLYFSWSNYDSTSTGIGRMDLTQTIANAALTLAYASDLMVTKTANADNPVNWLDIDPYTKMPLMSVASKGAYAADLTKYVPSGTLDSGSITYGIADNKIPVKIDMSAAVNGSVGIGSTITLFDPSGSNIVVNPDNYNGTEVSIKGSARSERINVKITLYSAASNTATPTLYRYTLKSWPTAVTETMITPVLMFYKDVLSGQQVQHRDPYDNFWYLQQLLQSQTIVQYKEGPLSANVIVEAMDWLPHKLTDDYNQGFVGDCVVTLKTIGGYQYNATPTQ